MNNEENAEDEEEYQDEDINERDWKPLPWKQSSNAKYNIWKRKQKQTKQHEKTQKKKQTNTERIVSLWKNYPLLPLSPPPSHSTFKRKRNSKQHKKNHKK